MTARLQRLAAEKLASSKLSCFLWGPRQTGKSFLLKNIFPNAKFYDLLSANEFRRLGARPEIFAEECAALPAGKNAPPVVVDEIQKLPELLDEAHKLLASRPGLRLILTGSSPRKLLRNGGNLLGGRVVRKELLPLSFAEIPKFSLEHALCRGLLPPHYLEESDADAVELLNAYVGQYLREEIMAEALVRNIPAFQRFLEVAALSNGQTINNSAIARDCGVSANTIDSYFGILSDTLVGCWVPAWKKRAKRRVIGLPRFWFFDIGVANELLRRKSVAPGSPEFGANFEHFVFMELRAFCSYHGRENALSWWRTTGGAEVDFILGDNEAAIEVKSTDRPASDHTKGLREHKTEFSPRRSLLVCRAPRKAKTAEGIEIYPWREFMEELWSGKIW